MPNKSYSLQVGDSFMLRDSKIGVHLHVIVAESTGGEFGQVMLVYITDSESFKDKTTIIQPGDHEFITQESWVKYQNVIVCQRASLEGRIGKHYGKVDTRLLIRIQNGILASERTPKAVQRDYQDWRLDYLSKCI